MRRLVFSLLLLSLLAPISTLAAPVDQNGNRVEAPSAAATSSDAVDVGDFPKVTQIKKASLPEVAATAVNFLLMLAGALAVIFLIVGGIRYIISSGSPDQMEKAKHTVTYAIIGILVVIFSYAIVNILTNID